MMFSIVGVLNLAKMNENKKGKPSNFQNHSFLSSGTYVTISSTLQTNPRSNQGHRKKCHLLTDHVMVILQKINKLKAKVAKVRTDDDDDDLIISIDSTEIKVTNRGHWINEKWNVQNKKGYLKIHVAVNIKTKEILALEVTDEKIHDSKMLRKLVRHVLDNSSQPNTAKIKVVMADGAYDSNTNFRYLEKKRIKPGIKVRSNSIVSIRNNRLRNKEVRLQKEDLLKWKKKRKYGHRWMAETSFSSIKRMFGEYTSATKFHNMVKEMMLKVSLYNLLRRI